MKVPTTIAGLLAAGFAAAAPAVTRDTTSTSITDCLGEKDVPTRWANSPDYDELAEPFNLRLPYKPLVIILPETNQHVQDAVACALQCNLKVQAKSGGHSYASFSSGGKDGAMMIDLESLQDIEVNESTGIAKVGGGVRLGNLALGVWDQGKRGLSHGTCPGVGIGGHFTHGGYGHTSRHWGLALDHIVAADVVLANGTLVHATQSENSQVFWAIRGAADSFGVVTTFYLQTHEAPESITYFSFEFGEAIYANKADFTNTFLHFQEVAKNASVVDDRISWGTYLDGSGYTLSGTFFGSVDEFNTKVKPEALRSIITPQKINVTSLDWISYLTVLAGEDLKQPLTGYDQHDTFFAKSITVPEADGLSAEALNSFYDYITKPKSVGFFTIINLYGGVGSAINTKDTNFAAYNDRDSLWVFQNYGTSADTIEYINGLNDAIISAQPNTHFGAYLNYVDPSYSADEAHKLYYGEELYSKLAALKKELDPNQVYWNPQAIGA